MFSCLTGKIRKGTDVDLLGFEDGQSLESKKVKHENDIQLFFKSNINF